MSFKSALLNMNNAILDLQAADYNTYERPLRRLALSLQDESLRAINEELKSKVDFDSFIEGSNHGGSFAGSATLTWPDDKEQHLGLVLHLIDRAGKEPEWLLQFSHNWFYSGSKIIAGIRKLTTSVIIPFSRDYKAYVEERSRGHSGGAFDLSNSNKHRVFIVHGHDEAPREMVARFLLEVGLEPVILHEQANRGMTVVEKLQANANVGFAVVLLTPDDEGKSSTEGQLKPRARQNVILELGYFVGLLGRDRVCALRKGVSKYRLTMWVSPTQSLMGLELGGSR